MRQCCCCCDFCGDRPVVFPSPPVPSPIAITSTCCTGTAAATRARGCPAADGAAAGLWTTTRRKREGWSTRRSDWGAAAASVFCPPLRGGLALPLLVLVVVVGTDEEDAAGGGQSDGSLRVWKCVNIVNRVRDLTLTAPRPRLKEEDSSAAHSTYRQGRHSCCSSRRTAGST